MELTPSMLRVAEGAAEVVDVCSIRSGIHNAVNTLKELKKKGCKIITTTNRIAGTPHFYFINDYLLILLSFIRFYTYSYISFFLIKATTPHCIPRRQTSYYCPQAHSW